MHVKIKYLPTHGLNVLSMYIQYAVDISRIIRELEWFSYFNATKIILK